MKMVVWVGSRTDENMSPGEIIIGSLGIDFGISAINARCLIAKLAIAVASWNW